MLSYQGDKKLESLLENLFEDDDDVSTLEDVEIFKWPGVPAPLRSCCTYNYGSYSA